MYQVDVEVTDSYQEKAESFDTNLRNLKTHKDDEFFTGGQYGLHNKE